jgi:CTP synthase (EC 6.3.4.2)
VKNKIALFCDVDSEAVIAAPDVPTIYQIPLEFYRQRLDRYLLRHLRMPSARPGSIPGERWSDESERPARK